MHIILLILSIYPILEKSIINNVKKDLLLLNKDIDNNVDNKEYKFKNINDHNFCYFSNDVDNETNGNLTFYTNGDSIFIKYYYLSFSSLLCGFLIILYGAYYYILSLIILSTLFIYYIIIILVDSLKQKNYEKEDNLALYLYLITFSFITGILLSLYMKSKESNKIIYKILKFLYGNIFGLFLFKTIAYYYFYIINVRISKLQFFLVFALFIFIGGFINLFLTNYEFLLCSTISGSYFIIISLSHILMLNYSDSFILDNNKEMRSLSDNFTTYTLLVIQALLVIISIIYQINHIKKKKMENPRASTEQSYFCSAPDMNASVRNSPNDVKSSINMEETSLRESNTNFEDDDEYINDQDE